MSKPLALSMGEPAGIGAEITLKAWRDHKSDLPPFFVIDSPDRLGKIANDLGWTVPISTISDPGQVPDLFHHGLPVLEHPVHVADLGTISRHTAKSVISSIERGVALCQSGDVAGLVTNPIHKQALQEAGFGFPGHTEFLADLAGISTPPIMMLASDELRVVPLTVHVSLKDAIGELSTELIVDKSLITHAALKANAGLSDPTLAFAGLNPHAGEGGNMGREEIEIIAPAVEILKAQGIKAIGPLPPDTMFHPEARTAYDVAMCMYHDQALIPLKTIAFDLGVNVTLGLPFIRTSPDHGTALDIAGKGIAREISLCAALKMAAKMATQRESLKP